MSQGRVRALVGGLSVVLDRHIRTVRFAIAAGVNTAFGLTIYPLLLWTFSDLRHHYMVGLAIAQVTSLIFAFFVYKIGVFRTRANLLNEFSKFSSFYLINYAANWVALPLLVEIGGISPIISQFGFALILMAGSWFWHSKITFSIKRDRS
ncbi:MAG: GtrA family protein [Sphingomonadales bacterium]|nr:GtrA family protein [Sphingomonadales bacterium]